MKIIALIGPAGSGKTTAAEHLIARYGARRYSFAQPLKEIAMRTLDFTHAQVYGSQAEKEAIDPRYGFSPRWFLQRLGTEGCRGVLGDTFWIDTLITRLYQDRPAIAVIDDCRFENESLAIRAMSGGQVWRLTPPVDRQSSDPGTHSSEQEWERAPYDQTIAPVVFGVPELQTEIDLAWVRMNPPPVTHRDARRRPYGGKVSRR